MNTMDVHSVESVAEWVLLNMDQEVVQALNTVDVLVIDKVEDAPDLDLDADARGCFLGVALEGDDEDEEPGEEPMGLIVLVASALVDEEDVQNTLFHEIGHALGLDEDEVADLGLE